MRRALAILVLLAPLAGAENFAREVWHDQKRIWSSPFRMDPKQLFAVALPLAGATAALIATDHRTSTALPNTPDQIRYSGYVSHAGDAWTLAAVAGIGMLRGRRTPALALADSLLVVLPLKYATRRERPMGNDRFSFPSGHAMTSFAVATAIARTPRCPRWVQVTAYTAAAAISVSRFTGRQHFASDVVFGGVTGALIGNYVATRPRR